MSEGWRPHPGQQTKFCQRAEFEVLFGGAAGPGKTECLVNLATRRVDHPNYKGIILRRTFPQLQEIVDRCWEYYPRIGGTYRSGEKRWYFPSGATINLGHMQHEDDKYGYQGKEYHFIGLDELTQFTETQYLYLHSRCRSTDPSLPTRFRSTTNPGGIGHVWVKKRFIDRVPPEAVYRDPVTEESRVFIPGLIEDNPTLFVNDPAYVKRLEALPEIEKLRLRHGIWDAFEGQVFVDLKLEIHACEPFDLPPEWERYCVLDWGYAKPFCVQWYAIDYDGVLYLYREWAGQKADTLDEGVRMRADQVAKGIVERETEHIRNRIADPSIFHKRAQFRAKEALGSTIHEDFAAEGLFFTKADNERLQGKQQVHRRLRVDDVLDESTGELSYQPHLQIFSDCNYFWETLPALTEDEKRPEDVDTDGPDHGYDCLRYMCMDRPVRPRPVARTDAGSFQGERRRLIAAKKHAQRHGVSLAAAYRRVR